MSGETRINIRYGSAERDTVTVALLGCAMHVESNYAPMAYDMFQVKKFAEWLLMDDSQAVILAETPDGEAAGMILCGATPSFFGPDVAAYEHTFFVAPAYRRMGVGELLRDAYIEWAKGKGAKRISAGNSACDDRAFDGYFVRLWAGAGFTQAGSVMYLNVQE